MIVSGSNSLAHHLSALFDGLDGGLRLDVVDDAEGPRLERARSWSMILSTMPSCSDDLIAHDDGLLDAVHVAQVLDGVRLEVGLGRDLEPLHVVVPPSNALDINEIHGLHVAGHRVAAVGAAAQGQRRGDGL